MSDTWSMIEREDRIAPYLKGLIEPLLFDTFAEEYLRSEGLDFMVGVPIPLAQEDLAAFASEGMPLTQLADRMALVCGADPAFPSAGPYLRFLAHFFDERLADVLNDVRDMELAQRLSNVLADTSLLAADIGLLAENTNSMLDSGRPLVSGIGHVVGDAKRRAGGISSTISGLRQGFKAGVSTWRDKDGGKE